MAGYLSCIVGIGEPGGDVLAVEIGEDLVEVEVARTHRVRTLEEAFGGDGKELGAAFCAVGVEESGLALRGFHL
jgi:hypothetical protein